MVSRKGPEGGGNLGGAPEEGKAQEREEGNYSSGGSTSSLARVKKCIGRKGTFGGGRRGLI
jgi:hypothetical protein